MKGGLVLDTSVMLNILGSGQAETVLRALEGRRIAVSVTSREVIRHPLQPRSSEDPLEPLIAAWLIEKIPLSAPAIVRFMELTGADPPDDLDDGEAAALAAGEALGLAVAIDERKARRVASARMPTVTLLSSGEIFAHPGVGAALGPGLADAVFSALFHARMRILPERDKWVRKLLGAQRAAQCPSLRKPRL